MLQRTDCLAIIFRSVERTRYLGRLTPEPQSSQTLCKDSWKYVKTMYSYVGQMPFL